MRRAARALAAALALLAAAAPVAGAQTDPEAIVGGGSFVRAPLIEPGAFRDTILPQEVLFYAIRLQAGEQLRVTGGPDTDAETFEASGVARLTADLYSPLRGRRQLEWEDDPAVVSADGPDERFDRLSTPIARLAEAEEDSEDYQGPGVFYLAIAAPTGDDDTPPRVEVPFTFAVERLGTPVEEPVARPQARERPAPAPAPAADDADPGLGTLLAAAAAGLALGLLLAFAAARALRRRRDVS